MALEVEEPSGDVNRGRKSPNPGCESRSTSAGTSGQGASYQWSRSSSCALATLPDIEYPAPLLVKNTFIDTTRIVQHLEPLDSSYVERKVQSCPASGIAGSLADVSQDPFLAERSNRRTSTAPCDSLLTAMALATAVAAANAREDTLQREGWRTPSSSWGSSNSAEQRSQWYHLTGAGEASPPAPASCEQEAWGEAVEAEACYNVQYEAEASLSGILQRSWNQFAYQHHDAQEEQFCPSQPLEFDAARSQDVWFAAGNPALGISENVLHASQHSGAASTAPKEQRRIRGRWRTAVEHLPPTPTLHGEQMSAPSTGTHSIMADQITQHSHSELDELHEKWRMAKMHEPAPTATSASSPTYKLRSFHLDGAPPPPYQPPLVDTAIRHSAPPPPPPHLADDAPVLRLSDALLPGPPILGSEHLPSLGSAAHYRGNCRPCAFLHTRGCENAQGCPFCHLCAPGEKKRRLKEKRVARREGRFNAIAALSGGAG